MEPPKDPSLFSSLPKEIVLSIFARISKSYYPTLSLVSKSFRSLIVSKELDITRFCLGTREDCLYVCLQPAKYTNICEHRWFSLWIKPNDHEPLNRYLLLQVVPCSYYSSRLPTLQETMGSETYEIEPDSTDVWVYNKQLIGKRRKAPSMNVARKDALTCSLDGKLYVLGGCEGEESKYWAEVFDPKTQTWEPLPDPGAELRFSSVKMLEAEGGEVFVRSNKRSFVYLTKQSKWRVGNPNMGDSICVIDNVMYCFNGRHCFWYDTKGKTWKLVQGLSGLDRNYNIGTEICNYGGKLVMLWVGPATYALILKNIQKIWCAVISLQKHNDGQIWGHVEWKDTVLLIPRTYTLLRCTHSSQ